MSRHLINTALYAGLAVALVATIAAGVHAVSSDEHAHFDPQSALLVSTRGELRVCLTTQGLVDAAAVADQLGAAFEVLRRHPQWQLSGYDQVPKLEQGCPATLPPTGVSKGVVVGPGLTEEPGPYRAVIVVLNDHAAAGYLGEQPAVLVPYELMRIGERDAASVTQAVVVRTAFLNDPEFATEYLTPAVGLDPDAR
jgi:hypothetical protein